MFFHKKRVQKVTCRRGQERSQLPEAESLVVEIDLPDGSTIPADLYDLSIDGSGVLVPADFVEQVQADDVLNFQLAHPIHGWAVKTPVQVVRIVPQGEHTMLLGMQFINTGNLYAQLDDAMGRYFNRRKLSRVHPDENQTIDVHISIGSNNILGRIYDISREGMGIAVPYVQAIDLHPDMEMNIKFRLPNMKKTVNGRVTIRQRRVIGEYGFVGMLLGDEFNSFRPKIEEFIEERRKAALEFEAGFEEDADLDDPALEDEALEDAA